MRERQAKTVLFKALSIDSKFDWCWLRLSVFNIALPGCSAFIA